MYSRHTIEHLTQCRSQLCTHTHVMRCFCACIMQLCHCLFIPCYIYNENYMCIHTHAYLSMHHLDIHIKVHTNSKSNIPIKAYMDITSHYHPGNDTHRSLGLVVTIFPRLASNKSCNGINHVQLCVIYLSYNDTRTTQSYYSLSNNNTQNGLNLGPI